VWNIGEIIQGKTEVLREKPAPVPLCPSQIPRRLAYNGSLASMVTGRPALNWSHEPQHGFVKKAWWKAQAQANVSCLYKLLLHNIIKWVARQSSNTVSTAYELHTPHDAIWCCITKTKYQCTMQLCGWS